MTKMPLHESHNPNTPKGKTVQLFIGPPDGHAAFMTSLHLDTSFAMMPRALRNRHPAAPDAPPVVRSKPENMPARWFEAQTTQTFHLHLVATQPRCQRVSSLNQVQRCLPIFHTPTARATYSKLFTTLLLDLTKIVFIMFMYSCSSVHHVDHP